MFKITIVQLVNRTLKLIVALSLCISLSACFGAVVGAVVDTTIEVVKIPFKVGAAVVDVVGGDDDDEHRLFSKELSSDQFNSSRPSSLEQSPSHTISSKIISSQSNSPQTTLDKPSGVQVGPQ